MLYAENAENNAIYFERKLINFENLDKSILRKFFDLNLDGTIDKDAEKLLNDLKHIKIRKNLPSSNIHEFEVNF